MERLNDIVGNFGEDDRVRSNIIQDFRKSGKFDKTEEKLKEKFRKKLSLELFAKKLFACISDTC